MAMTRTETAALAGVALLHIALFGWLSLAMPEPAELDRPPMSVEIIAEPAAVSTAPEISSEEPAPRLGEPDAADPPAAPPVPEPPRPVPPPPPAKIEPRPAPREVRQPTPRREVTPPPRRQPEPARVPERPAPAREVRPARNPPAPARPERPATPARPGTDPRPSGALDGIANSVARDSRGRAVNPPAERTATQIRADIRVSINAEVRAPWNGCRVSGADVERLRTAVVFRLAQSGALDRIVSVNTTGVTDSNRPQVQRFEECARRAITLAAPFNLPSENYQYWQTYTLDFDKDGRN